MIDVEKQVAYWRDGAQEDWAVARELVGNGRTRHGLFFVHLALEKVLKAHVCRQTRDLAPRIHNLVRLAELTGVNPRAARRRTSNSRSVSVSTCLAAPSGRPLIARRTTLLAISGLSADSPR